MEPQPPGGPQQGGQQVLMQMIQQLAQGQQQLQQALQESVSQQSQATARMSQAFQANMDQQLKIHQNVEKSIDVRDRSELKGIPKPEKFSGSSGTWDSWYYKFKTWIESCHKNAIQIIQKLESTVDVAITERSLEDDYPDGAELVSAQARQALISLTEGEALEIVKNTSRGTHFGLEALRRLLSKYDPQNPQANSALLKKVLHPQQCSLDKLREGLESWENLKRKYEERRKKQLEDDICRSCLQQMCPNKLQDHLDLQASRLTDYDSMKHEILAYIENVETRKEAKTGSAPMDVDSLAKSKGKGKDSKGKGKDGWSKGKGKGKKGKGKGGKDKGKGSWNQNQNGKGWNSNQWNQSNWNQQWNNNKGKGKDKGGKSKHGDKRVAAVENSEAEGSSQTPHQPEPEITALFALEEMAERSSRRSEHHHRSRSARTTGGRIPGGDVSEKDLMDRLEKIQHQMNRSAIHGLNVDQELVDAQQAIYAQLREMRSKALDQEAMARRAASAPAARDSRLQQDLDEGMHPRAAKKAEKDRQRAMEHQRRLAEEKAAQDEQQAKSRSKHRSPQREGRARDKLPSPRRHRAGKDRSEKKRRQLQKEKDQLTVEEEEALISAQLREVNESPEVKEQIAQVLREAYRQRFGTEPTPSSSARKPAMDSSYTKPVEDLDDLPSSELDELEEKFGQELEITSEGEYRLKGNEEQEEEHKERKRLEKEEQAEKRKIGKVDEQERERQRKATKEIEQERRRAREQDELERLSRERKEVKASKEANPKKVDEKVRPAPRSSAPPAPPAEVPHWINASDGSLKTFKEVHRLSQWQQDGKGDTFVSCLRCQRTIRGLEPYSLWAHIESKGCYPDNVLKGWRQQRKEREKKAEVEKAFQATQAEAIRKAQKGKEVPPSTLPPPTLGPSIPFPMRDAQLVKPKKGERVETITSFEVKDVPKSRTNPIRLKSRSRTPTGDPSRAGSALARGLGNAVKRAADTALQSLGMRNPPSIEPMSLIPREAREAREKRDDPEEKRSPTPQEGTRDTREVRLDEEDDDRDEEEDRRRRRFKYEDSSDSELNSLNQVEGPKASLNVIWATVDSGAATSCLPVEMCREKGLKVEKTTDLPYTTASGAPVKVHGICQPNVTIGDQDGSQVAGTGTFKAMDVAKPLLSVARLVNKGWEVCFKPGNSFMKFQGTVIPLQERGGVYKIPLDLEGFQGHRAG